MKRTSICLSMLAIISYSISHAIGLSFAPGTRVWNIAADNIRTTNTIESKVCNLTITTDFSGTFTVLDTVLSKMCIIESKAELLSTEIDATELNFNFDLSKVCAIEDNLNLIQLNLESLDTNGTFTALDGLKQTVCSKIELLNQQLSDVQTDITDLTLTEIDHAATIVSKLQVLDQEVVSINSILDNLNFDLKLNTACSLLDVIDSCLQTVESKVDLLDGQLVTGFAGTFTVLDANLAKACMIESLVDAMPMSFTADLSETFSALNALQQKVCTIESKVDNLDMSAMSVESDIDILDSKLDPVISKLCIVESKTDAGNTNICFSLFDNAIQALDQDCSILEVLNNNQMFEKSCTIESNLDAITNELLTQESKLEVIDNDLQTVASKVCAVEMDNVAISKLCLVDSKLDVEQNTALTIESIIDSFAGIESSLDLLNDLGQTIFSKLCLVENEIPTICSKLDALSAELQTIDSKLDVINPEAQSNFDGVITIESRIDTISFDQLVTNTLISKLCLIEDQVCTIESTLDVIGPLIGVFNMQAQELIGDFQETWTILQVIEDKLCTSESVLDVVSNKLISPFDADFSGVFTAIEAIDEKAIIVDVKVNTADNLIDAETADFSGVFTVLEVIQSKICLADDLVQMISAGLEDVSDCLGTPIFNADIGTTGFTISTAGRYYLAEDIDYGGTSDAITISTDDVFLDLNDYTLNYTGVTASIDGVMISTSTNVQVTNGAITNFTGEGISVAAGSSNMIFSNLNITDVTGDGIQVGSSSNIIVDDIRVARCGRGVFFTSGSNSNSWVKNSWFFDTIGAGIIANGDNPYVSDCMVKFTRSNNAFSFLTTTNGLAQRLIAAEAGEAGIQTSGAFPAIGFMVLDSLFINNDIFGVNYEHDEAIIMRNSFISNREGVCLTQLSANCYVAFNTNFNNLFNYVDNSIVGNTYLGNFAFNSTAVGDPNNTNYNILGASDITRKFVTISQTSSFSDEPTLWHNINMLP